MQAVSIFVSLVALLISMCSLGVAVLSYRRDRSKLRAWSRIEHHEYRPEDPLAMRVRILNVGRRPIALMYLVKKAGPHTWSRALIRPETGEVLEVDVDQAVRQIELNALAHRGSLTLAEWQAHDILIRRDDLDEFVCTHVDPPV